MTETAFADKVGILSEIWMTRRDDEDFEDLVEYADLGLPLAYASENDMVDLKPSAVDMINEAFDMLLMNLGVEDEGYYSLAHLLESESYEIPVVYINEDEEEEEEDSSVSESYELGFNDGALAEQKRVQEICGMQMTWAKQSNKGNDFMQWHNVSELLKPINFEYSEEQYRKDLENEGF